MASRILPLSALTAIGFASLFVALAPAAPAMADQDPYYRAPRVRTAPPPQRVRTVTTTRTVWRTRTVCYDYNGQPFDCRTPAPAVQRYVLVGYTYGSSCGGCAAPAPVVLQQPAVQYYAPPAVAPCGNCGTAYLPPPPPPPRYSSCGGCAPAVAAPPYIYVRAHGRHGHGHHHYHHGHPHGHYGYAAQ